MVRSEMIQRARELRRNQTPAETILWHFLRNRKFYGLKFLRQHPITCEVDGREHFFIADFYCAEKKLVLELDGKVHDYQQERDTERDMLMKSLGLRVLRIKNEELAELNIVKLKIQSAVELSFSPSLFIERGSGGE